MRLRVLTATGFLADQGLLGPDVGTLSGVLLRPFLDLTGDTGPINARTAKYAGHSLAGPAGENGDWLAPQGNVKRALRPNLIRESGLTEYDVTWPGELSERLVTEPWRALCESVERWPALGPGTRYRVVCALYKLGLFHAAVELAGLPDADQIAADDVVGLMALRVSSAMSKLGRSTQSLVPHSVRVYERAPKGGRARLAAAINLTIHFGRATRDRRATETWAAATEAEMRRLEPEVNGFDALLTSIALRAACFGAFVRGDHADVARTLDRAWELGVGARRDPRVPLVLADENQYALLETQVNAAAARKDSESAIRHARALTEHDPLEPRAWLQLGAVLTDDGRPAEALASFQEAATVGAPTTAAAWYCVARCQEALSDPLAACQAYGSSVAAEPLGVTALLGLHRTARVTGQTALAEWARGRLETLHRAVKRPVRAGEMR